MNALRLLPLLGIALFGTSPAFAADKVHLGKAEAVPLSFIPADIGVEKGFFAKYGLDVEIADMGGDAKLQQALAAGSLDFGLGSGPSMAFAVKGSPSIAVAAFAAEPRNMVVVVTADSPIKTVEDLKGKMLGVSSKGSLTDWLANRIAVREKWEPGSIRTLGLGSFDANFAATRTHQTDGMVTAVEKGYQLEQQGIGRILFGFETIAPHFHTHVVLARRTLIAENPELVTRFLKGFFAAIHFMKTNKAESVAIAAKNLRQDPEVMSRAYDREIAMLEDDGHFDPEAIALLKESYVEMGTLPEKPTDAQMFVSKFVPVTP
jgi:ABC-type nitrate/sulfonate/bicarbonate transport system substrate-binding protein